ncbi:GDSL-type esterase/lipase family protein [Gordonia sp. (in: high G+C Gram-positive bacteria)]|uniref:GDSL-type esterase/lipase family protein n=1 Tax=Gordonia sp. (in: high G+C Gram-positive bacteria) TaxID=84139 RepID=UPI003C78EAC9
MLRHVLNAVAIVMIAAISIAVSLWLTPMQTATAVGQSVRVGAAAPSWSWSGPGEVDLFGQTLPTVIDFPGPVRPRLELTNLQLSSELGDLVGPTASSASREAAQNDLRDALVNGWRNYLIIQVLIVLGVSLLLMGALVGWQRLSLKASIVTIVVGVLVALAINVGAVVATAISAADDLRGIDSLASLVGAATVPPPVTPGPLPKQGSVVVIGDSTAAGIGNPPLPNPTPQDSACERTSGSFAVALDRSPEWHVTNMACSSATIHNGLLGEQKRGDLTLPPQLPAALAAEPSALIISIGANDVGWSYMVGLCATLPDCGGAAGQAFFNKNLATFTRDYLVLLMQLKALPKPPVVVINQYYDPLPGDSSCILDRGITPAKADLLRGWLESLNTVLAQGAESASFKTAKPSFDGHGLCSPDPFVQGLDGKAPLHPTTAGGLAIALADQGVLLEAGIR